MPLREELEHQGEWLFRWRSYLPLGFIALVVLGICHPDHLARHQVMHPAWDWLCLAVSCSGLVVRALVIGHAPRRTSCRSTKHQVAWQLSSSGIYSVVRHPLYVGNFLIWLGVAMCTLLGWLVAIFVLAYWLYYERIMLAEEEYLRRQFGQEFVDWTARTPAFMPGWRNWRNPALPFSVRNVLRREYSGWLAVVAGYAGLEFVRRLRVDGRMELDLAWLIALFLAAAIYSTLRFLKRHTRWLKVEGR